MYIQVLTVYFKLLLTKMSFLFLSFINIARSLVKCFKESMALVVLLQDLLLEQEMAIIHVRLDVMISH